MITIGISIYPEKNSGIPIEPIASSSNPLQQWVDDSRPYGYRISGFDTNGYSGYLDYGQRIIMPYDNANVAVATGIVGTIKQIIEEIRVDDSGVIHGGSISLLYELQNGREATLPLIAFSNNKEGPNKAYFSVHNIDESDQRGVKNINVELNFFQFMDTDNPEDTQFFAYINEPGGTMLSGLYTGAFNNWLVINQNFPTASGDPITHDIAVCSYATYDNSYVISRDYSTTLKDVEELIRVDRLGIQTGGSQIYVKY